MPRQASKGAAVAPLLPELLEPQLATLATEPPGSFDEWVFEVKFDGYRMLARIEDDDVRLLSRSGKDWTDKLRPLQAELRRMALPTGWYDGEIVVNNAQGRPDFGLLRNAFDARNPGEIDMFLFDAPFLAGVDARDLTLLERRAALEQVLRERPSEKIRFSQSLAAEPEAILHAACQMGLEGLIGKRKTSRYVSRRSPDWIKLKCGQRQEFVVGGYTEPGGARKGFGALLLGTYDQQGILVYAGSVGTGFDGAALRAIFNQMQPLRSGASPFAPSANLVKRAVWLEPVLVAEIAFAEWTHTGSIRHATFRGMRQDKPAKAIRREHAGPVPGAVDAIASPGAAPNTAPFKVTHAERVMDPSTGTTKGALFAYYAAVRHLILPHLEGRPTSVVRAPAGLDGELFFQKDAASARLRGVRRFPSGLLPGQSAMLEVTTEDGVLSAVQWNVVEFHTQNAAGEDYQRPDRMIFDLDPGEGVQWSAVRDAAFLVRGMLDHFGLQSFLKTSGGKGLHVVVPIQRQYGWDTVKDLSKAIVLHMAKVLPDRFASKSGPANRKGKIFIDYLRNGRGATTAAAWTARARPGLGISVPIGWEELPLIVGGDAWTVASGHERAAIGNAPWANFARSGASISESLDMLELDR